MTLVRSVYFMDLKYKKRVNFVLELQHRVFKTQFAL